MPRGNRRGPRGLGPKTGRGLGYCNGHHEAGYLASFSNQEVKELELTTLENAANRLETELSIINNKLADLKANK